MTVNFSLFKSIFDVEDNDDAKGSSSPSSNRKRHPILTPRASEKNFHNEPAKHPSRSPMGGLGNENVGTLLVDFNVVLTYSYITFPVNWLWKEYRRSESVDSQPGGDDNDFQSDVNLAQQIRNLHHTHGRMSQRTLSK